MTNEQGYSIGVHCAAASHESRDAKIAWLTWDGKSWGEYPMPLRRGERPTSWVDANGRAVDRFDPSVGTHLPAGRLRFRFHCKLCGLSVVARSERLSPVLDRLRHAGINTIELSALGAIL